jgi:hypothetical protein
VIEQEHLLCKLNYMAKKNIPESVRRWYRSIGAKGGQAGKGTERRRELMRQNAHKRWNAYKKTRIAEENELRQIFVRKPATGIPAPK